MKDKKNYNLLLNIVGFLTGSAFNIFLFLLTVFLIYSFTVKSFNYGKQTADELVADKPSKEINVTIPDGAAIWDIAKILKDNGLIGNELLFVIQARLNGTYDLLKSGEYVLNTDMGTGKIMEELQIVQDKKSADSITITIPEGLTLQQISELLESKELFSAEEFLEACQTGEYDYDFIEEIPDRPNRLEGYLFPDTYFVSLTPTPVEVINKMLGRFDEIYDQNFRDRTQELGLTMDQIVIISSVIEGEISKTDERELASAIIYNRLEDNMPLQMCSSIMYALDKRKDRLLLSDLTIDSPYNTYIQPGLPIGPISNPGKASIEAALYPAEVDYLYFVLKDANTGEHVFTASYDVFLRAKDLYNQEF